MDASYTEILTMAALGTRIMRSFCFVTFGYFHKEHTLLMQFETMCNFKYKEIDVAGLGGWGWESESERSDDIFRLRSRKLLPGPLWGFLVPCSLRPHVPSTQASQVLFCQLPPSPAASLGSYLLPWVSCLVFVLLFQEDAELLGGVPWVFPLCHLRKWAQVYSP